MSAKDRRDRFGSAVVGNVGEGDARGLLEGDVAKAIVDKAEKVAASNRETSLQDTKREIEQMKKAAQAEIQRDRERAADQLKKEIVALSLLAAGKVVEKNMEASENEALVGDFIDKLDKDKIGDLSC